MLVWGVLIIVFLLILSTEWYAYRLGVPTVASFPSARRTIVSAIQQHAGTLGPGTTIVDLGSGNGQLATRLARAFPEARVLGIELSIVPWALASVRQKLFGPSNLVFRRMNFYAFDCGAVDVVVTYLTENMIGPVAEKLAREMKTGALVIANDTPLPAPWQPMDQLDAGLFGLKVFVYRPSCGSSA